MQSNQSPCYTIKNHELRIQQHDEGVVIELEDILSEKYFKIEIPDTELPILTKDLVKNDRKLGDIIAVAMDENKPNTQLSLNHKRGQSPKITITKRFTDEEGDETTISFDIELKEEELDKLQRLQKNNEKLSARVNTLQSEVNESRTQITQLQIQLKSGSQVTNSKLSSFVKIIPVFDPNGTNKDAFTFGDGNKAMTKTAGTNANWYGEFSQAPLNAQGKHKFSVKLLICPASPGHVMIGIGSKNLFANQFNQDKAESFCFYIANNTAYINGTASQGNNTTLASEGDTVSVYVDLDQNEIIFEVEDYVMYRRRVDFSTLKTVGLYPYVQLYSINDSVTFI